MKIDIVKAAEILGTCSLLLGAVIGAYKIYDKLIDRLAELERRITKLEAEYGKMKKENAIVIFALRACLDGLRQKGCNGKVTEAIDRIDKYINEAAHSQNV